MREAEMSTLLRSWNSMGLRPVRNFQFCWTAAHRPKGTIMLLHDSRLMGRWSDPRTRLPGCRGTRMPWMSLRRV